MCARTPTLTTDTGIRPLPHADNDKRAAYNRRYYLKKKKKRQQETGAVEKKILFSGRLPETLLARIQRITLEGLATGRYPWKTITEAVTNLLQRGLGTLKGDPFIDEMLPHLEMAQHLDRVASLRREAQTVLSKARQEIGELLNIGAQDGAITYYHVTMDAARKMPPTEWRDWLIKELKAAFPEFAKIKPRGINLDGHKSDRKSVKPVKKGGRQ